MDWLTWNWDEKLKEYVAELTKPVDIILLGRKLAEGFIPNWTSMFEKPKTADEFNTINKTQKLVLKESKSFE